MPNPLPTPAALVSAKASTMLRTFRAWVGKAVGSPEAARDLLRCAEGAEQPSSLPEGLRPAACIGI